MILHRSTWPEVEAYLRRSRGVVIPTGSTEQHGPHGLIGTDSITAESIAHAFAQTSSVLIGPTVTLSQAQFNLGFPGTVSLRPTTLIAVMVDYIESLACQGFTHFYLLNGHGGNVAPAMCAFQELYAQRGVAGRRLPPIRCRLRSWWDFESVNRLRSVWYGSGEGMHATPSEIAITRHVLPGCLPQDGLAPAAPLPPAFLRLHAADNHPDSALHRAQFPDGRVGSHSALGTAEQGKALVAAAAEAMLADYQDFLTEPLA